MSNDFEYKEVHTGLPMETALNVVSTLASLVPWLGGPVSNVLNGLSVGRKFDRVHELLSGLGDELHDFKSDASEAYVKTEEFEEILEKTLRQAADERSESKRRLLRSWLLQEIKHPGAPYDEQRRMLRLLDELQEAHIMILIALAQEPRQDEEDHLMGTPIGTLQERLPDLSEQRIEELLTQMNHMRITSLSSLRVMMTARGAADLRHAISPSGQRLISFVRQ